MKQIENPIIETKGFWKNISKKIGLDKMETVPKKEMQQKPPKILPKPVKQGRKHTICSSQDSDPITILTESPTVIKEDDLMETSILMNSGNKQFVHEQTCQQNEEISVEKHPAETTTENYESANPNELMYSGNKHVHEQLSTQQEEISAEKRPVETITENYESANPNENQRLLEDFQTKEQHDVSRVKHNQENDYEIARIENLTPEQGSIVNDAESKQSKSEYKTVLAEAPAQSNILDDPILDCGQVDDPRKANDKPLEKKPNSSVFTEKRKHMLSNRSSQSSLSSSGPSSSSLCHLTELSQPKPEALQTTLKRLRHLHGKDSQQLSNIAQHLRGLRNSPKHCPRGQKKLTNSETRCKTRDSPRSISPRTKTSSNEDSESDPSAIRQIFDRFAGHLFEHLERKRALENYEASKLMMPVEIGYYSAAYDALVQAFGHPYHKCTLELYQQLAAELGLEAEMFVIDKTPKTNLGDERLDAFDLNHTEDHVLSLGTKY